MLSGEHSSDPSLDDPATGGLGEDPSHPVSPDADVEAMVCPHCMHMVLADSHFCEHCSGPITSIASMDPLGSVYAQGFGFGKAVDRPTSPMIFWGMWLLLAPQILMLLPILVMVARSLFIEYGSPPRFARLLLLLLLLGMAMLYGRILYLLTKNYRAYRTVAIRKRLRCIRCNYDLRASRDANTCPECGEPIAQLQSDWDESEDAEESPEDGTDDEEVSN